MQSDPVYPEPLHLTRFFSHMRFFDQKKREKPRNFAFFSKVVYEKNQWYHCVVLSELVLMHFFFFFGIDFLAVFQI